MKKESLVDMVFGCLVVCERESVCVTERERAKGWLAAFVILIVTWRVKGRRWQGAQTARTVI